MIKVKDGNVEVEGTRTQIKSDLACIVKGLMLGEGNFSKDEIMESVELGMKPDKEIEEMAKDVIFDILKEIFHRNRENEDD